MDACVHYMYVVRMRLSTILHFLLNWPSKDGMRERERTRSRQKVWQLACLLARSLPLPLRLGVWFWRRQTDRGFFLCDTALSPRIYVTWDHKDAVHEIGFYLGFFFWIKGNLEECERASRYIGTWVIGEKMLTIRWSCCYCFRVESALLVSVE